MTNNYTKWAAQYADILASHGWIDSIVHGWVQDAFDRMDGFEPDLAYAELRKLPRK